MNSCLVVVKSYKILHWESLQIYEEEEWCNFFQVTMLEKQWSFQKASVQTKNWVSKLLLQKQNQMQKSNMFWKKASGHLFILFPRYLWVTFKSKWKYFAKLCTSGKKEVIVTFFLDSTEHDVWRLSYSLLFLIHVDTFMYLSWLWSWQL